jgi:hypothetical protein
MSLLVIHVGASHKIGADQAQRHGVCGNQRRIETDHRISYPEDVPVAITANIPSEISFVDCVRQAFITCGTNDTVEQNAAKKPRNVTAAITFCLDPEASVPTQRDLRDLAADGSAPRSEPIVDAAAHKVGRERDIVGRDQAAREAAIEAAQIDMKIFGFR